MPHKKNSPSSVDTREGDLTVLSPAVIDRLLRDHTSGQNIFWATHDYEWLGSEYAYHSPILPHLLTGKQGMVVSPRAQKPKEQQASRTKDMAEVFTPSWICNKQNNLVDSAWFGREHVFNTEIDHSDGTHSWVPAEGKITFPEGKTWQNYVNENRLEITCGEAPYLVSRYDAATGEPLPVKRRIGLLDRKLRVVSENTSTSGEWLKAAQAAFMSTYGYEWQGDNLLLARKNLLYTFIEYYQAQFGKMPQPKSLLYIAYIISWNIWQMDGLKGVIPDSCGERVVTEQTLFGTTEQAMPCEGCQTNNIHKHNGTYALVKDWKAKKGKDKIRFIDLIKSL